MKQIRVEGGNLLTGEIKISGAKNSAVALVPASLLCDEQVTIDNIPDISDIHALNEILTYLGATVSRTGEQMKIDSSTVENKKIPESISKKLRASYYFMGALLGKYKKVEMCFPGGCSIGARPIDFHLKAFQALGATIKEEGNLYTITADRLIGTKIYLDFASVGATINVMLAAVKAEGTTVIQNAAKEPEIVNVAVFLNQMGAKIEGAGTSEIRIDVANLLTKMGARIRGVGTDTITIEGVNELHGTFHEIIPDRIEAGTYVILGALIGDKLRITNMIPNHIESLLSKMKEMNVNMEIGSDYVEVSKTEHMNPVHVRTLGYPGFATDLQQPFTVLLTQAGGTSYITENIYENRFQNVPYLNQMGTAITVKDRKLKIEGKTQLHGETVVATDLRAGACLVLAGLTAPGTTVITEIEHVLRGYENIVEKLNQVGAKIEIEEI